VWGSVSWTIDSIVEAERYRGRAVSRRWFGEGSDAAAANLAAHDIWADAFAWCAIPNGDALGISRERIPGGVVYLSHDGDPLHGALLGPSLAGYLDLATTLGCPGPEAWMIGPFIGAAGYDLDRPASQERLAWLGL
jgi:hypothetical protein